MSEQKDKREILQYKLAKMAQLLRELEEETASNANKPNPGDKQADDHQE